MVSIDFLSGLTTALQTRFLAQANHYFINTIFRSGQSLFYKYNFQIGSTTASQTQFTAMANQCFTNPAIISILNFGQKTLQALGLWSHQGE